MQQPLQRAHVRATQRRVVAALLALGLVIAACQPALTSKTLAAAAKPVAKTTTMPELNHSSSPDRARPAKLDGARVSGKTHVFMPAPKTTKLRSVEWFLDGAPQRTTTAQPYDFAGTAHDGKALAWDTSSVASGSHVITARWTAMNGTRGSTAASFSVASGSTSTTAPPTTTTAPPPTTTTVPPTTTTTAPPTSEPAPGGFTLSKAWFQANTGPQIPLTKTHSGVFTAADQGKVFEGYIFPNGISTNGLDNITIRHSLIQNTVSLGWVDSTGWRFENVEIDGSRRTDPGSIGIGFEGYTLHRANVHGFSNGVRWSQGVSITESWIHDLRARDNIEHRSGIGSNGEAATSLIARNWIEPADTGDTQGLSGALVMYGDFGPIHDVTIKDNYLNGSGSYTLYAGTISGKRHPQASNVDVIGNRWGRLHQYGPVTGYSSYGGGTWEDNRYMDNGQLIYP